MPLALVLRLLLRVGASLLFWRFATARRGAAAGPRPPARPASARPASDRRLRLLRARERMSIAGRGLILAVLIAVTALCVAAGLGPAILGPRWLGAVLLVAAAAFLTGAVFEGLALQRGIAARNRRRHDSELTKQVYS